MQDCEAIAANRVNWDDRADIHARSKMYDVKGFLAELANISSVVMNDLSVLAPHLPEARVQGRSLLHLQCHIGTDTVSWARLGAVEVHDLLEPGGVFMIRDDHPILGAMAFEPWDISDDYLSGSGSRSYDDSGTYTENSTGQVEHVTNYEWRHDLGEVVSSLLQAGLTIEAFAELPYMDWPAFQGLVACPQGWTLPPEAPQIPLNFAVVARRPG